MVIKLRSVRNAKCDAHQKSLFEVNISNSMPNMQANGNLLMLYLLL